MADVMYPGAVAALRDRRPAVVERWLSTYARSPLRLPRPVDVRELSGLAGAVAEALASGVAEPGAVPGAPPLREVEKAVAFAGGSLGMSGMSAFDVVAFTLSLRDVLLVEAAGDAERAALARLFDWFAALAVEAYSTSRREALKMRYRDSLERGTPVVFLHPEVPAALLVGEPDRSVVESTFGRLLLATVRVGAKAIIIDGNGLVTPDAPEIIEGIAAFARHRKLAGVTVVLSGLGEAAEAAWRKAFPDGSPVLHEERFEAAVSKAFSIAGVRMS
jgi:hypothetical protein